MTGRSTEIHIIVGVFLSLSVTAVVLRFIARKRAGSRYALDDWLALASLIVFGVIGALEIWTTRMAETFDQSVARRKPDLKANANYYKGVLLLTIIPPLQLSLMKFSVLSLYWRIFKSDKSFRRGVAVLSTLSVAWLIASTIAGFTRCRPFSKSWFPSPKVPGKCYEFSKYILAVDFPNSSLDLMMVILPIRVIRQLQLPIRLKLGVSLIFVLGGFNGIIGFIRIGIVYSLANAGDPSEALRQLVIWLMIHLGTGIICCCLPTYRPLIPRGFSPPSFVTGMKNTLDALTTKRRTANRPNGSKLGSQTGLSRSSHGWYNIGTTQRENSGSKVALTTVDIQGGGLAVGMEDTHNDAYAMSGIKVQTDIKIT